MPLMPLPLLRPAHERNDVINSRIHLGMTSPQMPAHERNLELFKRIESAENHLAELQKNPGHASGGLRHWHRIASDARNDLIMANQGLVAAMVGKYAKFGLEKKDLMHEGTIGLIKAIEKFDYRRGFRLSTYATPWIQQAMSRAISKQARTIRIPEGQLKALRELKVVVERLCKDFSYEPSAEEIAWAMDLPLGRVRSLLAMDRQTLSMNALVGDADGATIIDFIADPSVVHPAESMDTSVHLKWLHDAAKMLTHRELAVLKLRFGLGNECKHTLEEIGSEFGISGERVRQILADAVETIRSFVKSKGQSKPVMNKMTAAANPCGDAAAPASTTSGKPKTAGLAMRSVESNPNHHIWNNNGIWFCNLMVKSAAGQSKRIRESLHTKNVDEARMRRDAMIRLHSTQSSIAA
ncbi:MAG: sigma-70 family RNA polymerase sigma factor [Verrucomicrobia bacterium]|nr:MAG: sigma-70 family RNA polymerase sigma factor [Verrucomicrobiota bacterium]